MNLFWRVLARLAQRGGGYHEIGIVECNIYATNSRLTIRPKCGRADGAKSDELNFADRTMEKVKYEFVAQMLRSVVDGLA